MNYQSTGTAVKTQINDLHEITSNLSNDINNIRKSTGIIKPIDIAFISNDKPNSTLSYEYLDNGEIRFTCHKENGYYGFGLLISNNFSLVKNKNIQLLVKSNISCGMIFREYVTHYAWGGYDHKDTNTPAGPFTVYSDQIIGNKINKLIFNTNTDKIYDNDNLAFIFEFNNNIQEDFIFDILINDITDNINDEYNIYELNKLKSNIGFISFDDVTYSGFKNSSVVVANNGNNYIDLDQYIIATKSHSYSYNIKFKPFTLDVSEYNNPNRLWLYGSVYVRLNNFLFSDNNYTFYIKIHRLDGSLPINTFSIIISSAANNWQYSYSSYFNIHSNTYDNDTIISSFNTASDVAKTELDSSKNYYLNIRYNKDLYPSNNEIISTYDSEFEIELLISDNNNRVLATNLIDFDKSEYYTKSEINEMINIPTKYITCWGDSLTAGGGWTAQLSSLSGLPVYNGGTGGENSTTIVARQGADAMIVNNITIPADTSEILITSRTGDTGITTVEGKKVAPLLQGGSHVNPCKIGDIEGTLRWTGSNYADTSGTWVFKRSIAGDAITINRPTVLRTNFDMTKNDPYLMIIFIGQNGGWNNNLDDLVRQHKMMIEHSNANHVIILGLSSGSAASREDYEARMKKEFGRYFISLREYLSTPIYENGEIVSCYGIADQDANVAMDYISQNASGKTVLQEINDGIVPHAILADGVHYTSGTKTVIGNLIYKRCKELNIF